ncbi:MAG: YCF48-related protein [Bacteroidetes bacterium]|nr:YCF48-related protein [Bacteroidota bacterium]
MIKMKISNKWFLLHVLFLISTMVYSQRGWTPQSSGITKTLTDVHFESSTKGWVVGYNGTILKTTDGGENWELQILQPSTYWEGVWFTSDTTGWVCGTMGKIYHTMDGGNTWTEQINEYIVDLYDVCFINSNTGWIVGDNGVILNTNDGGEHWYFQFSGTMQKLLSVSFSDVNNGWATGGTEIGVLIHTLNGGDVWTIRDPGINELLYSVFFINPYIGWVGLNNMIVHSTDVGDHWTEQLPEGADGPITALFFINENKGWALQGDKLYYTTTSGAQWTQQFSAPAYKFFNGIHFSDENNGWVVGKDGIIFHTTDGGISDITTLLSNMWNIFPNPGNGLYTISPDNSICFKDNFIQVYDAEGHPILKPFSVNGNKSILDLMDYPDGIYYVQIGNKSESTVKKVIKF